jgi:NAD-dependent DNA ligase
MNFNCVGKDSRGDYYMKFREPFSIVERIQLLQRWILVQSFSYYEMNENIASDFDYDKNAKQLAELKKQYPEEFKRSSYYDYFHDFCSDDDSTHTTSGFDLLRKIEKQDRELYRRIWIDAIMALDLKQKRGIVQ